MKSISHIVIVLAVLLPAGGAAQARESYLDVFCTPRDAVATAELEVVGGGEGLPAGGDQLWTTAHGLGELDFEVAVSHVVGSLPVAFEEAMSLELVRFRLERDGDRVPEDSIELSMFGAVDKYAVSGGPPGGFDVNNVLELEPKTGLMRMLSIEWLEGGAFPEGTYTLHCDLRAERLILPGEWNGTIQGGAARFEVVAPEPGLEQHQATLQDVGHRIRHGDLETAAQELAPLLELPDLDPDLAFEVAIALKQLRDYGGMIDLFETVVAPVRPRGRLEGSEAAMLAYAYLGEDRVADARALLETLMSPEEASEWIADVLDVIASQGG